MLPRGALAEWLGSGLQSRLQRFDSARRLYSRVGTLARSSARTYALVVIEGVLGGFLGDFILWPLVYLFVAVFKAVRWLVLLPVLGVRWVFLHWPRSGGSKPPMPISKTPRRR